MARWVISQSRSLRTSAEMAVSRGLSPALEGAIVYVKWAWPRLETHDKDLQVRCPVTTTAVIGHQDYPVSQTSCRLRRLGFLSKYSST